MRLCTGSTHEGAGLVDRMGCLGDAQDRQALVETLQKRERKGEKQSYEMIVGGEGS